MRPVYAEDPSAIVHGWRGAAAARRTSGIASLLLAALLLLPVSASAIDRDLCADDGVSEVPDFAEGRDSKNCLMLDPGNGDPPVPFQYEFFHKRGTHTGKFELDLGAEKYGECRTRKTVGEFCSFIMWDTHVDAYMHPDQRNEDAWIFGGGHEILLFKDSMVGNTWKCKGQDWDGPNGITCTGYPASGSHTDALQTRGQPVNGGWLVFQDSFVGNGPVRLQNDTSKPGADIPGNFFFQGTQVGNRQRSGEAITWMSDCQERGSNNCGDLPGSTSTVFTIGRIANEIWMVDTWGSTRIKPVSPATGAKTVVVNTGCGKTGCGGEIRFQDGWPWPLNASGDGPGVCPNGLVGRKVRHNTGPVDIFCYTSMEEALNDVPTSTSNIGDCPAEHCPHKAPPFSQLSAAGWDNPPVAVRRPAPPELLP